MFPKPELHPILFEQVFMKESKEKNEENIVILTKFFS